MCQTGGLSLLSLSCMLLPQNLRDMCRLRPFPVLLLFHTKGEEATGVALMQCLALTEHPACSTIYFIRMHVRR